MKILYGVGFSDWWGKYPPDILDREDRGTVGGGEAGALNTAFALAALGHQVTYCSVAEPGAYRNVTFRSSDALAAVYEEGRPWDAILAWSRTAPVELAKDGEARLLVQQLNDLCFIEGWWRHVDLVVSPSWTHAKYLAAFLPDGVDLGWHAVGNGVHLDLFPWPAPDPSTRPMQVGWWSSPDRGLHHLLRAWPLVRKRVPGAKLKVFYQVRKYLERAAGWRGRAALLANILGRLLAETEGLGVELVDQIPRKVLAREQRNTRVQAYSCDPEGFTEGFATSVLESLAAGCLPILRPVDALPELWDGVVRWIEPHPVDADFTARLADLVVWGLTEWAETPDRSPSLEAMRARAEQWTWDVVGKEMEVAIHKALARKREAAA